MDLQKDNIQFLKEKIAKLEAAQKRQRFIGLGILTLFTVFVLISFIADTPQYIKVRGITIVDAAGKARLLMGAPAETAERIRKDGQSASIVVLGPQGQDRVIIGEIPNPVIAGKTYPRIDAAYGLTIHDSKGQERGGINWLDNGRGVISLDRPNADAVEMVVNDKTGFAGLTMNFERPFGQYKEAVRIGTKGSETWWALSDTSENVRAALYVKDLAKPAIELNAAGKK